MTLPEKQELDNSTKARYLRKCDEMGIQPATFYIKHMSDSELVMKFHGLGPHGMKAMADSLEVIYIFYYILSHQCHTNNCENV